MPTALFEALTDGVFANVNSLTVLPLVEGIPKEVQRFEGFKSNG